MNNVFVDVPGWLRSRTVDVAAKMPMSLKHDVLTHWKGLGSS